MKKATFTLVLLLLAALSGTVVAQSHLDLSATEAHSLAGSWVVTVKPDGAPSFVNYTAMHSGGRVVTSNETGKAAIGEWVRVGGNQFAVTFMGFDVADGQTIGYKVRGTLELSQDAERMMGPFVTDIFDAEGKLLFSVTGKMEGTRIHVEPMP
jgi:hypothetical protein